MEVREYLEKSSEYIFSFLLRLSHLSDTYAIFDALLSEARKISQADAGTLYIVRDEELLFSAAQNDTLFPDSEANRYAYMNARIPLDLTSIAGYVAATGKTLNIPDVNRLSPDLEYSFNYSFDCKSGYRTRSMLVVPLINGQDKVIGVLQLINSKRNGEVVPFDKYTAHLVARIASLATLPLEKALLAVNMIMRMLKTSALRDPSETASHVQRVGSVAAELYDIWAAHKKVSPEEILANKSRLRLAAMLHDIGKVGIPDSILKKPGKLTEDERRVMETHAALGAGLFSGVNNEVEEMARDITLHHHARWDGNGYSGAREIASPSGENIPVWARIVAIADVYDALISRRCYKEPMSSAKALKIIQSDAGGHFDPDMVKRFIEIQDLVSAIYERYNEHA